MSYDLATLLRAGPEDRFARLALDQMLTSPLAYPTTGELATLAARYREPPQAKVGETAGVGVHGNTATVYALSLHPWPAEGIKLKLEKSKLAQAQRIALTYLPRLGVLSIPAVPVYAYAQAMLGELSAADTLQGSSLDVAVTLLVASQLAGQPVPGDLCASAQIDSAGALQGVAGLPQKVAALAKALGWQRFVVATSDVAQVKSLLEQEGRSDVKVLGYTHIKDMLAELFADATPRVDAHSAQDILRTSLAQQPSYAAIARTAAWLQDKMRDDSRRYECGVASAIARRHEGEMNVQILPPNDLDKISRPIRLQLIANMLQAATDGGLPSDFAEPLETAARAIAAPQERHIEDAELLGAMGRAYRQLGQLEHAEAALREAFDTFVNVRRPKETGRVLCAWVHVLSAQHKRTEFEALLTLPALASLDETSKAFLAVEIAAAWFRLGEWARCEQAMAAIDMLHAPDHLQMRLARLTEALLQRGRTSLAGDSFFDEETSALAALDTSLVLARSVKSALERVRNVPALERFMRFAPQHVVGDDKREAEWLLTWYPY